jgi:RHS repeat-associated protein
VLEGGERTLTLEGDADVLRRYVYGPQGQLLFDQVFDGAGNPASQTEVDLRLPLMDHQNSTRLVLGHDAVDSAFIRQSVDYAPFGQVTAVRDAAGALTTAALDTAFAHHGSVQDPGTKLQLKGARWYSPDLGRFVSEDPIEDGANWYAFAGNDPVNFADPSGLSQAGHPLAGAGSGDRTAASTIATGNIPHAGMGPVQVGGPSLLNLGGGSSSPGLSYTPYHGPLTPTGMGPIRVAPSYVSHTAGPSAPSGSSWGGVIASAAATFTPVAVGVGAYYAYNAAKPHVVSGWDAFMTSGTYLSQSVDHFVQKVTHAWSEAAENVQFVARVNAERSASNAVHREAGRYGHIEPLYGLDQGRVVQLPLSPSDARGKAQIISQIEADQRAAAHREFLAMMPDATGSPGLSVDNRSSADMYYDRQRAYLSDVRESVRRILGNQGDYEDALLFQHFDATRERNALDKWREFEAILPLAGPRALASRARGPLIGPKGFSNLTMGNQQHARFRSVLVEQTRTRPQDWRMRTAPGQNGVDAEYIGPQHRNPGFRYAELKPFSLHGFNTFLNQLGNWQGSGSITPGNTQLWFYGPGGVIGSSGQNY